MTDLATVTASAASLRASGRVRDGPHRCAKPIQTGPALLRPGKVPPREPLP